MGDSERLARRVPGLQAPRPVPQAVTAELVRGALVERLQQRFTTPVTTIVAGAGFGKSTTLAQAVRHNAVAPLGVDAWVTCRPGHENAEELAGSLLDVLGGRPAAIGGPLEAVVGAIVSLSPIDVCLVLDDCHLLPTGSSSERMLSHLVRRLPNNGHLVLSGRRLPDVPLARLKAAGAYVGLDGDDLLFSDGEVTAVAELLDRDPADAGAMGGWPALVRLALVARAGADREFLREELLAGLAEPDLRALVALVVLGPSTDDVVRAVVDEPTGLADLAERLPLINTTGDGVFSAHQLWEEAALAALPGDELAAVRKRAHAVLLASGELSGAAALSIADRDWDGLGRAAVELIAREMIGLPADTVRSWLRVVPDGVDVPGLRMLAAAAGFMDNPRHATVQDVLDEVAVTGRTSGDVRLESVAIAVGALVAHGRNDYGRLVPMAVRASELAGQVDDPVLQMLACSLPAIGADLAGDPEGVIAAFEHVPWERLPAEIALTAVHLRLQAMWMSGLAVESVALADATYGGSGDHHLRGVPWLARWFAGDPTGSDAWEDIVGSPSFSARNVFVSSCLMTVIDACRGDGEAIEQRWARVPAAWQGFDDARDSAHLTYAHAARDLCHHDEAAAAEHYRLHLDRFPADVALGERHLRRWPALGYVLSPELRDWWDAAALGPAHVMARECGRALLAAREGRLPEQPPTPPQLFTQLPLVWSMELAGRWHALGAREGVELASYLVDVAGPPARAELARSAGCHTGAARLARLLPATPAEQLQIRVLGPLQLLRNGVAVDDPGLRRQRVRQLLMLLTVERTVRRDRVLDLLWPDLGREAASTNLRVTLAHLRRIVEPDRVSGDPGYHLRADGTTIALHESAQLSVDLWDLQQLHAGADQTAAPPHRRQRALQEAVDLWRGDPLDDLLDIEGLAPFVEHLRRRYAADLLHLGELHIAAGQATAALDCAERVLAADPYREQAHRLAIAALHQLDDPAGISAALHRLDTALDDLGVDAEGATDILRRQATRRYGMRLTSLLGA